MSIPSDVRNCYLNIIKTAVPTVDVIVEGTTFKQQANKQVVRVKVLPRETTNVSLGVNPTMQAGGLVAVEVFGPKRDGVEPVEDLCQQIVTAVLLGSTPVTSGQLQTLSAWAEATNEDDIYLRGVVFIRWSLLFR